MNQTTLLDGEPLLSIRKLADQLPAIRGNAETIGKRTISRWITIGCLSRLGRRVKLEAVRVGGQWLTSQGALERFSAALTDADRTQRVIHKSKYRQAEKELDAAGI